MKNAHLSFLASTTYKFTTLRITATARIAEVGVAPAAIAAAAVVTSTQTMVPLREHRPPRGARVTKICFVRSVNFASTAFYRK